MARRQQGFSLVELLMALLVLAIVITTTMAMFVERQKRMQQANETILVWQALMNESEVWRRIQYDQLEKSGSDFKTSGELLAPLAPYSATVTVGAPQKDTKIVTMSVRWRGGQRVERLAISRVDTGGTGLW